MTTERIFPYHRVEVAKIKVGLRTRTENEGEHDEEKIQYLKESIDRNDLYHPLVIDQDYNLVAGFRRLMAVKQLQWIDVPCHFLGELTEEQRLEIELEENIARKDFTWQERCTLRDQIHELKMKLYGQRVGTGEGTDASGWSQVQTAELVGSSQPRVAADIAVAKVIQAFPTLAENDSMSEVQSQIRRLVEQLERELSVRKHTSFSQAVDIWPGDVLQCIRHVPDANVDLVICDPPYGINVENVGATQGRYYRQESHFQDDKEHAQELFSLLLPHLARVMKENAHAYFFFGITEYTWVRLLLLQTFGDRLDLIPLIWSKGKDHWGTGDWGHKYARQYEGIFFVSSPSRRLSTVHGNILEEGRGESTQYVAEKPQELLRLLVEQSTQPGELVLDPTCGHGATVVAAISTGRRFWACEISEPAYQIARSRAVQLLQSDARTQAEKETPNAVDLSILDIEV